MPLHAGAVGVTKNYSSRFSSKQVSPSRLASGNYPVVHIAYDVNVMGPRWDPHHHHHHHAPCICHITQFSVSVWVPLLLAGFQRSSNLAWFLVHFLNKAITGWQGSPEDAVHHGLHTHFSNGAWRRRPHPHWPRPPRPIHPALVQVFSCRESLLRGFVGAKQGQAGPAEQVPEVARAAPVLVP